MKAVKLLLAAFILLAASHFLPHGTVHQPVKHAGLMVLEESDGMNAELDLAGEPSEFPAVLLKTVLLSLLLVYFCLSPAKQKRLLFLCTPVFYQANYVIRHP